MGSTCSTVSAAVPPSEMVAADSIPSYLPSNIQLLKVPIEVLNFDYEDKNVASSPISTPVAVGFIPSGSKMLYLHLIENKEHGIKMWLKYTYGRKTAHTSTQIVLIFKSTRVRW